MIGFIVDIDGTLVDSNYQHVLAWARAFADHDVTIPAWRLHRHVGMGGDQLVPAVAGDDLDDRCGDAIRAAEGRHYSELIHEVEPLAGARDLLAAIRSAGHQTVLTTSAKPDEVRHYLDLLDAHELVDATATGGDVEGTKPQPDLMHAAVAALPDVDAYLVIGDAVWDVVAACRADLTAVGVLTGGFGEAELRDAGAVEVFEGPHAMADDLASAAAHAGGDRRAARS